MVCPLKSFCGIENGFGSMRFRSRLLSISYPDL
jgi:hypothetical protein